MHVISRRQALWSGAIAAAGAISMKCSPALADASSQNALAIMSGDSRFSTWVEVLRYAGLQDYAAGSDNFTGFIPTDAAFQKYPWVINDVLKAHTFEFPATSVQVEFVRSHVISGLHSLSEFSGKTSVVTSISGNPITIDGTAPGSFTVTWQTVEDPTQNIQDRHATARFTNAPIVASNALIYAFDDVTFS